VNVGAGAGSYEPTDRHVFAIEPSDVMAAQRASSLAPALRASADALPFRDGSVNAAMAVLSVHHFDANRAPGVREMRRVARGPVVIVTFDPRVSGAMWLTTDYLPEVAELDHRIFPHTERIAEWLGGHVAVEPIPIHRDTPDWMLGSFWAHPERSSTPRRGQRRRASRAWKRRSWSASWQTCGAISPTARGTGATVISARRTNATSDCG
jgi:SAM-dependent methyltransferase